MRRARQLTSPRSTKPNSAARAQLEDADARRVRLEQDHEVQLDTVRREADIAHSVRDAALGTAAAEQLDRVRREADAKLVEQESELETWARPSRSEIAVRAAKEEAAKLLVETINQHGVALAKLRADAHADAARAAEQVAGLMREIAAAERTAAETARQHEAAFAAQETELEVRAVEQVDAAVARSPGGGRPGACGGDSAARPDGREGTNGHTADAARVTDEVAALKRQLVETERATEETTRRSDAALADVRANLEAAEARACSSKRTTLPKWTVCGGRRTPPPPLGLRGWRPSSKRGDRARRPGGARVA